MNADTWKQWMTGIPAEGIPGLIDALDELGHLEAFGVSAANTSNGHTTLIGGSADAAEEEAHVKVTRMPTDACYVSSPVYVDALGLFPLFEKIAFKANLLLKGPKGTGKSLAFAAWAAHKRIPMVSVECSEDTKKYDLMGSPFIIGDETIFVLGGIPTAIEVANEVGQCILNFEEVNSLTPQVQKTLNAAADWRQAVSLPHIGKVYRLRPGAKIWLVASQNPTVYGGTYDLNEDLKSRFEEIEITYPEDTMEKSILKGIGMQVDEEILKAFLLLARETRTMTYGYSLSTRDLVRILTNVELTGLETTLRMLVGKFEDKDKDLLLKRLPSIFHGIRFPPKFWGG